MAGENAGKKNQPILWTKKHQEAFEKLKSLSLKARTRRRQRSGNRLCQQNTDQKRKTVQPHKLEFLALKSAITDRFHEYLYGGKFDIYTDNNPLTYVLTTAKLNATGQRWIAALGMYHFKIYYRSGKSNGNADALSRIPWNKTDLVAAQHMDEIVVKATMAGRIETVLPLGEDTVISLAAQFFAPDYALNMETKEWIKLQQRDPIMKLLKTKELNDYKCRKNYPNDLKALMKFRQYLSLREGILHRSVHLKHQPKQVQQVVLPASVRRRLVLACHDDMGHLGMDRVRLCKTEYTGQECPRTCGITSEVVIDVRGSSYTLNVRKYIKRKHHVH